MERDTLMISSRNLGVAVVAMSLVLLAGCFLEKEQGRERTLLKYGAEVPAALNGWVAVSPAAPKTMTNQDVTYHVLATHNLVLAKMQGYKAISPALFERLTKIKVEAPAAPACSMWTMKEGKKVTKEMDGWVGLPLCYPEIQKQGDAGLANLVEDQIIPKEMNGWVALDTETFAKIANKDAMQGRTEPDQVPIKSEPMKPKPVNAELQKGAQK
jgi:hypothetical protein